MSGSGNSQNCASPCLINSLPKSGTHLLAKIIRSFPGVSVAPFSFEELAARDFSSVGHSETMIPLGVGHPKLVPREEIVHLLKRFEKGTGIAHTPFSTDMADLLVEMNIKMVLIIRDPRDVVVSHAKYLIAQQGWLAEYYRSLSEPEQLMTSIVGVRRTSTGSDFLSIKDRLERVLPWRTQSFNHTTTFERLIGPQGGGSQDIQMQEIQALSHHLGIVCSERELTEIADNAFGATDTFRKGVIGSWRESCAEVHKQALKELVGQHLIDLGYEEDLNW